MTVSHILTVTRSANTMVVFNNSEEDDTLTLTSEDIEERPRTRWTRSRYVIVLSLAGCLLTSMAVVTTMAVYLTSDSDTPSDAQDKEGECRLRVLVP